MSNRFLLHRFFLGVLVLSTFGVAVTYANFYQCVNADGKVEFTDQKCPETSEESIVKNKKSGNSKKEIKPPIENRSNQSKVPKRFDVKFECKGGRYTLSNYTPGGRISSYSREDIKGMRRLGKIMGTVLRQGGLSEAEEKRLIEENKKIKPIPTIHEAVKLYESGKCKEIYKRPTKK